MKQGRFEQRWAKPCVPISMGFIILMMVDAGATTLEYRGSLYNEVSCDKMMDVYKQAYIAAGFKFKKKEIQDARTFLLHFEFENPREPKLIPSSGSLMFYRESLDAHGKIACRVFSQSMGAIDKKYTDEQYNVFAGIVGAALREAETLVGEKMSKSIR